MDTPSAGQRRFVTVVRTDVEGSTRLGEQHDPELIRTVLGRYYEAARSAFERHGGTIEQYQGDAVVALFGVPQLHEDDALRAVRAAMELRDRTDEIDRGLRDRLGLRLPIRTAVHSGEIVTGSTAPGQLTGDVMNVVAHLEKLAEPGQIILGDSTLRLVRGAVQVQELGPRKLKRRSAPVIAHRLVKVRIAAMRDEFEKARELLRETETVNEYADTLVLVGGFVSAGLVELLADRPAAAERVLRRGYRTLEDLGGRGSCCTWPPCSPGPWPGRAATARRSR
jgi:class 3 adenylate cyclase